MAALGNKDIGYGNWLDDETIQSQGFYVLPCSFRGIGKLYGGADLALMHND